MAQGENWKKDRLDSLSVKTLYEYSKLLTKIVSESPRPYDTWMSVFEEFKPPRVSRAEWLDGGRNEMIKYWVNSDRVFTRMLFPNLELFPGKERIWAAYRGAMLYALREGSCNDYHYKHLLDLENKTE